MTRKVRENSLPSKLALYQKFCEDKGLDDMFLEELHESQEEFFHCVRKGDLKRLEELINHPSVNIDAKDRLGWTGRSRSNSFYNCKLCKRCSNVTI